MMSIHAVIGANFGDEGKGLITDFLAYQNPKSTVIRFNGGAQAGHTVVTPEGKKHVFGHVGSGTFVGCPTHLSQFFISNPILLRNELEQLKGKFGIQPAITVDPRSIVTTPYDMVLNQYMEKMRGKFRHGSCGCGINETVERSKDPKMRIQVKDLANPFRIRRILSKMSKLEYLKARCVKEMVSEPETVPEFFRNPGVVELFIRDCDKFIRRVGIVDDTRILKRNNIIFEGAQGLLLDQDFQDNWPHVTSSKTGFHNVNKILREAGVTEPVSIYYVTRTYLTRHGAGPLLNEFADVPEFVKDTTNVENPHQGRLRFATLRKDLQLEVVRKDLEGVKPTHSAYFAVTHKDQLPNQISHARLESYGPTRKDVHFC